MKRNSVCPDFSTAHTAPGVQQSDCRGLSPPTPNGLSPSTGARTPPDKAAASVSLSAELPGLVQSGERVKSPPALPLPPPQMLLLSQLAQHSRDRPVAGGTPPTKLIRGFPAKGSSPAQVNTAAGSGMSCQEGGRTRLKPEVDEGSCYGDTQGTSGITARGRRGGERPPPGRVPRPPQWRQPSQTV